MYYITQSTIQLHYYYYEMSGKAVAFVRATYTDDKALQEFLVGLFGHGNVEVVWKRGRFQCTIPRPLSEAETVQMQTAVNISHY